MVLKAYQQQLQYQLAEAILTLCQAKLPYRTTFNVAGNLNITLDECDTFSLDIEQQYCSESERNGVKNIQDLSKNAALDKAEEKENHGHLLSNRSGALAKMVENLSTAHLRAATPPQSCDDEEEKDVLKSSISSSYSSDTAESIDSGEGIMKASPYSINRKKRKAAKPMRIHTSIAVPEAYSDGSDREVDSTDEAASELDMASVEYSLQDDSDKPLDLKTHKTTTTESRQHDQETTASTNVIKEEITQRVKSIDMKAKLRELTLARCNNSAKTVNGRSTSSASSTSSGPSSPVTSSACRSQTQANGTTGSATTTKRPLHDLALNQMDLSSPDAKLQRLDMSSLTAPPDITLVAPPPHLSNPVMMQNYMALHHYLLASGQAPMDSSMAQFMSSMATGAAGSISADQLQMALTPPTFGTSDLGMGMASAAVTNAMAMGTAELGDYFAPKYSVGENLTTDSSSPKLSTSFAAFPSSPSATTVQSPSSFPSMHGGYVVKEMRHRRRNSTEVSDKGKDPLSKPLILKEVGSKKLLYQCQICGKMLKTITGFYTHYRGHTGEKPFVCTNCGKGYADKSNLNKHAQSCMG